MRLDMVQRHALGVQEPLQGADLIDDAVGQLFAANLHLAPTEALQVWKRGMCSDLDAMAFALIGQSRACG
jgi:hypothetical protein